MTRIAALRTQRIHARELERREGARVSDHVWTDAARLGATLRVPAAAGTDPARGQFGRTTFVRAQDRADQPALPALPLPARVLHAALGETEVRFGICASRVDELVIYRERRINEPDASRGLHTDEQRAVPAAAARAQEPIGH